MIHLLSPIKVRKEIQSMIVVVVVVVDLETTMMSLPSEGCLCPCLLYQPLESLSPLLLQVIH